MSIRMSAAILAAPLLFVLQAPGLAAETAAVHMARVLEGAFAGLTGIFQLATAEERALLLIDLLGRQNSIHVPLASIA